MSGVDAGIAIGSRFASGLLDGAASNISSAVVTGDSALVFKDTMLPRIARTSPDDDGVTVGARCVYSGNVTVTSRSPTNGTSESFAVP